MPPEIGAIVRGGQNLYGRPLGILMLQSRFPRIPGDAGNASTWPFPVSYRVVADATPAEGAAAHLAAAGVEPDVPVVGMEETGGHFVNMIVTDALELDVQRARDEHVAAARLLVQRYPEVGAIVLECTNMPPYAADIAGATGLPVHDFTTFVTWALSAHRRTGFSGWM